MVKGNLLKHRTFTGCGSTCLLSQLLRRWRQEDLEFKVSLEKVTKTLSQKQDTNIRAGSVTQVVNHKGLIQFPVLK
jgi:hypothetical protein